MRRFPIPTLAALLAAAGTAAVATAGNDPGHGRGHGRGDSRCTRSGCGGRALLGLQKTVGVPNLVADMNRQRLAFTAHDGDLKQGSNSPCDDALYGSRSQR